ncbi:uncharacterized protein V6R79_018372 [Siganus canaliculatus]
MNNKVTEKVGVRPPTPVDDEFNYTQQQQQQQLPAAAAAAASSGGALLLQTSQQAASCFLDNESRAKNDPQKPQILAHPVGSTALSLARNSLVDLSC